MAIILPLRATLVLMLILPDDQGEGYHENQLSFLR